MPRKAEFQLRARRLGVHALDEALVFMRRDCHICRAEGLTARSRVSLASKRADAIATLIPVENDWLGPDEAGLSEVAWRRLAVEERELIAIKHAPTIPSESLLRRRIYGGRLDADGSLKIFSDIVAGRYSDVHLSAFVGAGAALPFDRAEMAHLTRAMVEVGRRLTWPSKFVLDKHCIGGLPGNRTTPIVVAILASLGWIIPKTSSRAITSPAGTADVMETLTTVDLDLASLRKVVREQGACLAWGGAVDLSPADDILIRIERALDIDAEGQLVASVLSKKIAAGATHVVFDLPVGPTAKVRTDAAARALADHLNAVAAEFGLQTRCILTDGSQPVGRGIGPALEARDVLAVLQNSPSAPPDLRERALALAASALELAGAASEGQASAAAIAPLEDGRAWAKFAAICEAQGGLKTPPRANLTRPLRAQQSGIIRRIDNRKLARLAKLTGAPGDKAAGVEMHARLNEKVAAGGPLVTLHACAQGRLDYALDYAAANADIFEIAS